MGPPPEQAEALVATLGQSGIDVAVACDLKAAVHRWRVVTREHVIGDLYDLAASSASARVSEASITVFKNDGGADLDLMIAAYIARVTV